MSGLYTPWKWKLVIIGAWLGAAYLIDERNWSPMIFALALAVTIVAPLREKK